MQIGSLSVFNWQMTGQRFLSIWFEYQDFFPRKEWLSIFQWQALHTHALLCLWIESKANTFIDVLQFILCGDQVRLAVSSEKWQCAHICKFPPKAWSRKKIYRTLLYAKISSGDTSQSLCLQSAISNSLPTTYRGRDICKRKRGECLQVRP